jgi:hypothetical protein
VPGKPGSRSSKPGAATCWPAWPGTQATRTGSSRKSKPAGDCPARPILRSQRGAQVLLANAAFLAGDLSGLNGHGRRAIELARTAAGQEGLALALTASSLSAISGAGIQPAIVAALDEAASLLGPCLA